MLKNGTQSKSKLYDGKTQSLKRETNICILIFFNYGTALIQYVLSISNCFTRLPTQSSTSRLTFSVNVTVTETKTTLYHLK